MSLIRVMTREGRSVIIPSCDIGERLPDLARAAAERWATVWARFDQAIGESQSIPPASVDGLR